jgi:D-alanyl-D-alanine carboxypeptidase (penicillin-binding protein 5/6)
MNPANRLQLRTVILFAALVAVAACGSLQPATPTDVREPSEDQAAVLSTPEPARGAAPYGGGVEAEAAGAAEPAAESTDPVQADTGPSICPAFQEGSARPPVQVRGVAPPTIGATAAVVIDADSGTVLWGRDEHRALQPASVTKIVTALIAIERGDLDEVIPVTLEQRLLNRGTRMGLVTGDWFTLRDLLYGLMLPSGNDAAAVIADHFAGSEAAFAELMNGRMCELGLVDSRFINPSGLGRTEHNLASAFDLAQVTRAALTYPAFREVSAARAWTAAGSRAIAMRNLNELVGSYAGADGVKIGWTPGAGNTIVASATRNGHRVIVALLNTPNRAAESAALLEWVFASYRWPA